ncbi:MAG: hypothetical protein ABJC12_07935 [Saprospiraceae bacterium]
MSPKHFFGGLAITGAIQICISLLLLWCIPSMKPHVGFVIVTILALIIFCITLFVAAKILARSSYTKLFIQMIMLAVFLKMLLCIALIIGYQKIFIPVNDSYIWPFLVIYLTSTIFEVIFLEKVGHEKQSAHP